MKNSQIIRDDDDLVLRFRPKGALPIKRKTSSVKTFVISLSGFLAGVLGFLVLIFYFQTK